MSYSRSLPSHLQKESERLRGSNPNSNALPSSQSPILVARVNEKRLELENLKQLKDLSAALAGQMATLEQKLATLADGTEAVASVLSNWHNVLRAISMASMKIPRPKDTEDNEVESMQKESEAPLPQTLVRIPTEHAPILQQHTEANGTSDE